MNLLFDSDVFCKIAVSELLRDATKVLGAELQDCGRLPALPHMLQRGRLRLRYGAEACDSMLQIAQQLPSIPEPSSSVWLDPLVQYQAIDPGEALIFATAAESGARIVSGDKRALEALKDLALHRDRLEGRIVVLEALLLKLCRDLGTEMVRQRVRPLEGLDRVVRICFSQGSEPEQGLRSYFEDLQRAVSPLVLWDPRTGDGR
jgi:hypothetical protein